MTVPSQRARRLGLAAICLGFLMITLDATIVNVALGPIVADLGGSLAGAQWIVSAYTIAFATFLLSAGALADRIGSRRAFLGGLVLFALASAACAAAPSMGALVAARAVQGLGAAALMPCSLALITHTFPAGPERRGALAAWGGISSLGLVLGPLIGGALVDGDRLALHLPRQPAGRRAGRRRGPRLRDRDAAPPPPLRPPRPGADRDRAGGPQRRLHLRRLRRLGRGGDDRAARPRARRGGRLLAGRAHGAAADDPAGPLPPPPVPRRRHRRRRLQLLLLRHPLLPLALLPRGARPLPLRHRPRAAAADRRDRRHRLQLRPPDRPARRVAGDDRRASAPARSGRRSWRSSAATRWRGRSSAPSPSPPSP